MFQRFYKSNSFCTVAGRSSHRLYLPNYDELRAAQNNLMLALAFYVYQETEDRRKGSVAFPL